MQWFVCIWESERERESDERERKELRSCYRTYGWVWECVCCRWWCCCCVWDLEIQPNHLLTRPSSLSPCPCLCCSHSLSLCLSVSSSLLLLLLLENLLNPVISDTLLEFIIPLPLQLSSTPSSLERRVPLPLPPPRVFHCASLIIISDVRYSRSEAWTSLHRWWTPFIFIFPGPGPGPGPGETMIRCSNLRSALVLSPSLSVSCVNNIPSFLPRTNQPNPTTPTPTPTLSFFFLDVALSNDLLNDVVHLRLCSSVPLSPTDECLRPISCFSTSIFNRARSWLEELLLWLLRWGWVWQRKGFASSTRRMSSGSTRYRHRGHVECASSHVSTHSTWNACLHFGNSRRTSAASNFVRHTAQSSPSFCPRSAPNLKTGSDSTTDRSMPEFFLPENGATVHGIELPPLWMLPPLQCLM